MADKKKRTVLVVTGTRAEYGLLRPVLRRILESRKLELKLLVTGIHTLSAFGSTIDDIKKDGIPIAHIVPVTTHDSMLTALTKEIKGIEVWALKHTPDMILVWGDRDEAFAGAVVAGHLNIPLVHIGGGDVSGYGVDEKIRHAISKFAHLHFAISNQSANRLKKLGEEAWRIHVSGTTAFEDTHTRSKKELAQKLGLSSNLPWILVSQHPTPQDKASIKTQITETIEALKQVAGAQIWVYPNSDTGADVIVTALQKLERDPNVFVFKSLSHEDYISLLSHVDVVVGNSSSGIVEAGYFHTPVVNIGNRQKGRECGKNVMQVGYARAGIKKAVMKALSPSFISLCKKAKHPYGNGKASRLIVSVLEKVQIDEKLVYKKI